MWRILEVSTDDKAAPNTTSSFIDNDNAPHSYIFNYDQLDRSVENIATQTSHHGVAVIPTVSAQVQWSVNVSETAIEHREIDVHNLSTNRLSTDTDNVDFLPKSNSTEKLPRKVFADNASRRSRSCSLTPNESASFFELANTQQTKHFSSSTIDHRSSFS